MKFGSKRHKKHEAITFNMRLVSIYMLKIKLLIMTETRNKKKLLAND